MIKELQKVKESRSLTSDEEQEYLQVTQQLAQTFPALVKGYDSQGNAILKTNKELEKAIENTKEYLALKKQETRDSAKKTFEDASKEIKKSKDELKQYKQIADYNDKGRPKWDLIADDDDYKVAADKAKQSMLKAQSDIESGNAKVIIPLNGYSWLDGRFYPTDYKVLEKLKDIEKVFNYLDNGLTEDINIDETLKLAEHYGETKKIELKYFYVTFYKKGTCHIEFKDEEILKKFNIFGSQKKNWLPPSYGKVKYQDMTTEEKDVINDFEGEQSYSETVNNISYYIIDTSKLLMLTS